jgi:hypothetical protein
MEYKKKHELGPNSKFGAKPKFGFCFLVPSKLLSAPKEIRMKQKKSPTWVGLQI